MRTEYSLNTAPLKVLDHATEAKERGYTVAKAAVIIGIGRSLAYDLINRAEFPVIQLGNRMIRRSVGEAVSVGPSTASLKTPRKAITLPAGAPDGPVIGVSAQMITTRVFPNRL
jgi:hypothetical protein